MPKLKKALSPRDVAQIRITPLPLEGEWQAAFGQPSICETWFVCGQSASGKSSFVMQLAKMLCGFGNVLYLSLEEGVSLSFQERLARYHMDEVQGKFRVVCDDSIDALRERLKRPKSARFVIVDSFQYTNWTYAETKQLVDDFPKKSFIFISQEAKSEPLGKAAVRLKYMAGVKVRTVGYRAYCQGRFIGDAAAYYTIWEEGAIRAWNEAPRTFAQT